MERIWFFIVPIALLALLEAVQPRRQRLLTRRERWPGAILLLAIGSLLARLLVPTGLIGLALWSETTEFGLFHRFDAPLWALGLLGYIVFDLAVWLQHVAMHRFNVLWRFHRVHHADPDFDVFTAVRFHPAEILVSLFWKGSVVVLIGLPTVFVVWYEIALNLGAMFNHSNLRLPKGFDKWLRLFVVTPDMHRVHHSTDALESNRNYGFLLPWWDRLFRLYQDQPAAGHARMEIGQPDWRTGPDQSIWALLSQPLKRLR